MLTPAHHLRRISGFSLLEVLITIVLLSFGLLGLAALQSRSAVQQIEAFQRTQAQQILADAAERVRSAASASSYVTANPIGKGDSQPADCSAVTASADHDLCELSNLLKGAAEVNGGANVGGMVDARACITQIRAPDSTAGVCAAGIYSIAVAWQGISATVTPANTCGSGSYGGNDSFRRVITTRVLIPLPACT